MVSGKKIRNRSLTYSAVLSSIVQNITINLIEDKVPIILNHKIAAETIAVLLFIISFVIFIYILQLLAKIKWIRVHIFKEKIIEGKWFECIYNDVLITTCTVME